MRTIIYKKWLRYTRNEWQLYMYIIHKHEKLSGSIFRNPSKLGGQTIIFCRDHSVFILLLPIF